jgi:hypothetical protein
MSWIGPHVETATAEFTKNLVIHGSHRAVPVHRRERGPEKCTTVKIMCSFSDGQRETGVGAEPYDWWMADENLENPPWEETWPMLIQSGCDGTGSQESNQYERC